MTCAHSIHAVLRILLLFLSAVLAFDVLHESDSTLPARSQQLTLRSENHRHRQNPALDYPISDRHGQVFRVNNFNPLEELRYALDVMQDTWFEVWVGTWPTAIDWTRAVLDTYLVSAIHSLGRIVDSDGYGSDFTDGVDLREIDNDVNKYFTQNVAYYFGEDAFSLRNQAYDDMLWVVLGWLEGVKSIKARCKREESHAVDNSRRNRMKPWHGHQLISTYAHQAHVFYSLAARGWGTELCGGGMIWNPYVGPYKNAITNELFISASVGMYLYFPGDNNTSPFMLDDVTSLDLEPTQPFDRKYLQAAVDGYAWLKNSNMTNKKGLFTDGFHISDWKKNGTKCDARNNMVYTYNQAVILSGLRGLWESTGNKTYLSDGHELARDAIKATGWSFETASAPSSNEWVGLGRNGILEDHCDASGDCNQDVQTFKGIFFHHLTLFCEPLPLRPVVPGKTHCAVKMLAFLHRQSCLEYAVWTAHNAQAALGTRDEKGRFGMWWGAREGVGSATPPEGAVDYRSDASELLKPVWKRDSDAAWSNVVRSYGDGLVLDANGRMQAPPRPLSRPDDFIQTQNERRNNSDLNDRGRGRTVETQGGGVAVLRALVELLGLE